MIKKILAVLFSLVFVNPMLLFAGGSSDSSALPQGGNVVAGNATISSTQTQTLINQLSNKAIINWNSFSIGANNSVQFIQPGSGSVALNRVVGTQSSSILGSLSANGQIFLINPNGILFGAGSHIDAAGLVASTFDISNHDFLKGKYRFSQNPANSPSYVINQGNITINPNGFAYLVAPGVANSGVIIAQKGQVALASGKKFTLDFAGDGLMQFAVTGKVLQQIKDPNGNAMTSAVSNTGTIQANGGSVLLTGDAAQDVVASVVNNGGIIEAQSLTGAQGSVKLIGGAQGQVVNTGTIDTSAAVAGVSGGTIDMQGYEVGQFGTLLSDAIDGGNGGTIDLYASDVLALTTGSFISANAGLNGNGGSITAYSPDTTIFWGGAQIDAKGGSISGNGGNVEVSGLQNDQLYGTVDTSAPNGNVGDFLVDPYSITIESNSGSNTNLSGSSPYEATSTGSIFDVGLLALDLNGSDVTVETTSAGTGSGDITLSSALNVTGTGKTLTLSSYADVDIDAPIVSGSGSTNFIFTANNASTGTGDVNIDAALTTNGGSVTTSGVNFTSNSSGTISTGNGAVDIQNTGAVSLGANINPGNSNVFIDGGGTGASSIVQTGGAIQMGGGGLALKATGGIGSVGTPIATTGLTSFAASSTTGGVFVSNTSSGAVNVTTVDGISGIDAATSGNVKIINTGRNVTISQAVTTNNGNFTSIGANFQSTGSGTITTNGGNVDLSGQTGTINIGAAVSTSNGNFTSDGTSFTNSATINAGDGTITLDQSLGITIGADITTTGAAYLTASTTNSDENIISSSSSDVLTASSADLVASGSIGSSTTALYTDLGILTTATSADSTSGGGIYINNTSGATLALGTITASQTITEHSTTAAYTPFKNGSGDVILNDQDATTGTQNVEITSDSDIEVAGQILAPDVLDLTATSGSIYNAYNGINFVAQTLNLTAGGADGIGQSGLALQTSVQTLNAAASAGGVFVTEGNLLTIGTVTADGNVGIAANSGNILLGTITASGTGRTVTVTSSGGSITDNTAGADTNITASGSGSGAVISGYTGIGTSTDFVSTDVKTLSATTKTAGTAKIYANDSIAPSSLTAITNGSPVDIAYTGSGPWSFTSTSAGSISSLTTGSLLDLTYSNTGGNVTTNGLNVDGGTVTLDASQAIIQGGGTITAATATLSAGTDIGTSGTPIVTDAGTLGLTATDGYIYVNNTGSTTLSATATGVVDINSSGNIALMSVSTAGAVTLDASSGNITDDFGNDTSRNISADSETLTASGAIGASGADGSIQSIVTGPISATGSGDIYLTNDGAISQFDASTTGGNISLTNNGDVAIHDVTASGSSKTITIDALGNITHKSGGTDFVTGTSGNSGTLNITGTSIGTSGTPLTADVAELTASATNGGIYLNQPNGGLIIDSLTAVGAGSNIAITADGAISLGVVTAAGNDVNISTTSGAITDGRTMGEQNDDDPNVTSNSLEITAPGGIGTSIDPLSFDVTLLTGSSAGSIYSDTVGPVQVNSSTFVSDGNNVVIQGQDITILDDSGGTMSTGGGNVTITADEGDVVFLDLNDTIDAGGGNITITATWAGCSSGCADLQPGRIIVGNLTTSGTGTISLHAKSDISIGNLTADSTNGTITVDSDTGLILGNNPGTTAITAHTVNLTATLETPTELADAREDLVSAYDAKYAEAQSELVLEQSWSSTYTELSSVAAADAATEAADQATFNSIDGQLNSANSTLSGYETTDEALNGTLTAAAVVVTAAQFISGAAQAIPFSGDAGADEVFAGISAIQAAAQLAVWSFEQATLDPEQNTVAGLQSQDDVASANLTAATEAAVNAADNASAANSSLNISTQAYDAANLAQEHAAQTRVQAIDAANATSAIGASTSEPLIVNATTINITGTNTSAYIQAPSSTTIGLGAVSLSGTGAELWVNSPSGGLNINGASSASSIVLNATGNIIGNGSGSLATTNNGSIQVLTTGGVITTADTVTANGSGNVTLTADAGAVTLGGTTSSTSGNIDITGTSIAQNANISTGINGTVTLEATGGAITMENGTTTTTSNGLIDYDATAGVALSALTSSGNVDVTAGDGTSVGAITDVTTNASTNIAGNTVTLNAQTGIGSFADPIQTDITTLAATNTTSGGIYVTELDTDSNNGLTIGGTGVRTLAGNGPIDIDTLLGNLVIDDVVTANGSGSITLQAAAGAVTVGAVVSSTTGGIAVTADTNVAQNANITTGNPGTVSVTAQGGTIVMGSGTTTHAGSGGIFYTSTGNQTLETLTTTNSGAIVADASAGGITADDTITANGTGNILLDAVGASSNLAINANVLTTTGNISLDAGDGITVAAGEDITTGTPGTVYMDAALGALTMNGTADATATSSSLMLHAAGDITLGNLTATNVSVSSSSGNIISGSGSTENVTATNLRLDAHTAVGTGAAPITTHNVATLTALGSIGGVYLSQDTGSTAVGSVAVTVNDVNSDGTTNSGANVDAAQTDLTSGANGNIVLTTLAGGITLDATNGEVSANGSGNILLDAIGGSSNLTIDDSVLSGTGNISLDAGDGITVAASQDITTGTPGTLYMNAATGALDMDGTSSATATGSSLMLHAAGDITLGNLTAANVSVYSSNGNIINGSGSTENVTATNLRLDAHTAIGTGSTPITTHNVATLTGLALGGGIYLSQDTGSTAVGSVAVTVNDVNANGTTAAAANADTAQTGLTSSSNGNIVLAAAAGGITLDASTGEVSANGSGNILLDAIGASSNLAINDSVLSGTGNISLDAGDGITVAASQDITTGTPGTVYMDAALGALDMDGTSSATATGSSLMLHAHGDITLGNLTATNVSVYSSNGNIINGSGSTENVTATNLRLDAHTAIGTGTTPITTHNVGTLTALASNGGVYLSQDTGSTAVGSVAVTVNDVNSDGTTNSGANVDAAQTDLTSGANGNIVLTTLAGGITLDATNGEVSDNGSGNILIDAIGATSNLAINDSVLSGTGNISLDAGDGITEAASQNVTTGTPGTVYMDAALGALTMNGTADATATSSSLMLHAFSDITLGNLTATNVSVSSSNGNIINGSGSTENVTATNLRLDAHTAIGTGTTPITTHNVGTLTALASNGGVYLSQDTGSTAVGSVAVTVNDVNANGTTNTGANVDAAQTGLTTSASNGNIVLKAAAGSITLDATSGEVSANGSGNILIDAIGATSNLAINDSVLSGTGNISLDAGDGITEAASQNVTTGTPGTVYMDAALGALTMNGTANVTATSSSLMLHAHGDITLGNLTATNVSVSSSNGNIINGSGSTENVTATNLRLDANSAIGTGTTPITTHNVGTLTALASNGGVYLSQDTGSTAVGSVAVTVNDVNSDGTTNSGANVDAAQTDLTSGANGNIVLTTLAGGITLDATNGEVSANGSGNILIDAIGATSNLAINDSVLSGTGNISLDAGDGITVAASQDITTGTPGTVYMDAALGALDMDGTSSATATGSSLMLHATGDITLGNLTATNVSVSSSNGNIINGSGSTENVTATNLRLDAHTAIGTGATPITTHNVGTLTALASNGGVYLSQDTGSTAVGSVAVTVNDVNANGTTNAGANVDAAQTDLTSGVNGNIVLKDAAGSITLDATNGEVSANGSGNILIDAIGASSNLIINDSVLSTTGNISLDAGDGITVAANQNITTGTPGTVYMDAALGTLDMDGTSSATATGSSLMLHATGDITLGNLTATNVSVSSSNGNIINGSGSTENVTATNLRLDAHTAVGTGAAPITTHNVATLTALGSNGGVYLSQDTGSTAVGSVAVTVNDVNSDGTTNTGANVDAAQTDLTSGANGNIVLTTLAGGITLDASTGEVSANGSGNVLLDAIGAGSNLTINDSVLSGTGNISLKAGDGITVAAGQDITTATPGTVYMDAALGALTMAGTADVTATGSSLMLHALNDITIGNLTATDVSIVSTNGSILSGTGSTDNVTATDLRLNAGNGVGSSTTPLTTTVSTVSGRAAAGGINITDTTGLTVDDVAVSVNDVNSDGTTGSTITDATQSDLVTTGGGNITVRTLAGDLTLNDGTAPQDNTAITSSGNVTLEAADSINQNADITAVGNISLTADTGNINTAVGTTTTSTGGGSVTLNANNGTISTNTISGGTVNLNGGTIVNPNGGTITSTSVTVNSGNVTIGTLGSLVGSGNGFQIVSINGSTVGGLLNGTVIFVPLSTLNSLFGTGFTNFTLQDLLEGEDVQNSDPLMLQL